MRAEGPCPSCQSEEITGCLAFFSGRLFAAILAGEEGWLNGEVPRDRVITCPAATLPGRFANGAYQVAFAVSETGLRSDTGQRRKRDTLQERPSLAIDLVRETGGVVNNIAHLELSA